MALSTTYLAVAFCVMSCSLVVGQAHWQTSTLDNSRQQDRTKPILHPRFPSSEEDMYCSPGQESCCLHQYTIPSSNITQYIVQPQFININYCAGTCIHKSFHQRLTNGRENPCCSPTAFESVEVDFFLDRSVQRNTIPDIRATRCGCK